MGDNKLLLSYHYQLTREPQTLSEAQEECTYGELAHPLVIECPQLDDCRHSDSGVSGTEFPVRTPRGRRHWSGQRDPGTDPQSHYLPSDDSHFWCVFAGYQCPHVTVRRRICAWLWSERILSRLFWCYRPRADQHGPPHPRLSE